MAEENMKFNRITVAVRLAWEEYEGWRQEVAGELFVDMPSKRAASKLESQLKRAKQIEVRVEE